VGWAVLLKKLGVLLTNDDGFHADGLQTLYRELVKLHEVAVVAPDRERSAVGHGITMHQPLRVTPLSGAEHHKKWTVDGTPADCVKIALETLSDGQPPDLILSGINRGSNLGGDVLYSGTVSAALEGSIYQVPSIALSLAGIPDHNGFEKAAVFTVRNLERLFALAQDAVLNINFPSLPEANEYQGVKFTRLGRRVYRNVFEERKDPRGRIYYWMGGELLNCDQEMDSDILAVEEEFVSITPLHSDLTDYTSLSRTDNTQEWFCGPGED
jgi:5'-nucleotidase